VIRNGPVGKRYLSSVRESVGVGHPTDDVAEAVDLLAGWVG
jgi:hypothetical protein